MREKILKIWLLPFTMVVVGLIFPLVATNKYWVATGAMFMIQSLLIVALTLLIGWAGQISLGHSALYALGAYTSALTSIKLGLPFFVAFFLSGLVSGVFALIIGLPSLRLKGHYLAMATLGFTEIIQVILVEWTELTGGTGGIVAIPAASFGKLELSDTYKYFYFCLFVFVLLLSVTMFVNSRYGRALKALRGNELAAETLGLNTASLKLLVFVYSGIIAGFACSLYAHLNRFISPDTFTLSFSIILVAMVVIGGAGSIAGALSSALLLTFLSEHLRKYQDLNYLLFGGALVVVVVVLFARRGLSGLAEQLVKKLTRRRYLFYESD